MARMRELKPSFFLNEILCSLPPLTRLLFEGLWCHSDRLGRLEDRPRRLKTEILPYDDCDVDAMLQDLHETIDHDGEPFIIRYSVGGVKYIQVVKFLKHQCPHKNERESVIPASEEHPTSTLVVPPHARALGSGKWEVGNGNLEVGSESTRPPGNPFAPKSFESVLEYATAIGHPSEARKYFDARQAVGWHKNRQPILDWQADLRVWTSYANQYSTPLSEAAKTPEEKRRDKWDTFGAEANQNDQPASRKAR